MFSPSTQLYHFTFPRLLYRASNFSAFLFPHLFLLLPLLLFLSAFLPSFLLVCRDSNMLMSMGWCLLILRVSLVIRDVEYLCMFPLDI